MKTYDGPATLTDTQVIEFCKKGFIMLEGVVPDVANRKAAEYLKQDTHYEPSGILEQEWFQEHVVSNPQAIGAVRSLLGAGLGMPIIMSNHRVECPAPAQGWHRDGGSKYGPEVDSLQVFYLPEDCPREMGPTALLPGSHFLYAPSNYMGHYGNIQGAYYAAVPAGSIFITIYSIWHRRSKSTGKGIRNLLKYNYWRNTPPVRDWVCEPGFDPEKARFDTGHPTFRVQFRDAVDAAQMYFWLCGRLDVFDFRGGQAWPIGQTASRIIDKPWGFPENGLYAASSGRHVWKK
ncbi:MAG: phytanoyl-CoA dioxygenase family protein [candidate division Zixibacteria bacterium]|nr:phytanoyl-CoA dioxygenase family protein [candidate division Zixibacteria bacterium]